MTKEKSNVLDEHMQSSRLCFDPNKYRLHNNISGSTKINDFNGPIQFDHDLHHHHDLYHHHDLHMHFLFHE